MLPFAVRAHREATEVPMPNIFTYTEQFDNGVWIGDATVTADTHAAPAFAGGSATQADTLTDPDASQRYREQAVAKATDNTDDWIFSLYVRKDADATRFPTLEMGFAYGGTQKYRGISINTSDGSVAAGSSGAPADSGSVDVDATWWRFWMREPDNTGGNTHIRVFIYPARASVQGTGDDSSITGSFIVWGANMTQSSTLETYDPHPSYAFTTAAVFPLSRRSLHHYRRDVFRSRVV